MVISSIQAADEPGSGRASNRPLLLGGATDKRHSVRLSQKYWNSLIHICEQLSIKLRFATADPSVCPVGEDIMAEAA